MADGFKVTFLLWILASLVALVKGNNRPPCLTGTVTDVQSWVTETGELTSYIDGRCALDLSAHPNGATTLQEILESLDRSEKKSFKYLSLARNSLNRIPAIFDHTLGGNGQSLAQTVEYLTFYGNQFVEVSTPGVEYEEFLNATDAAEIRTIGMIHRGETRAMWSTGFQRVHFKTLKELDLRNCNITTLESNTFQNMPQLQALYLSGNCITSINNRAFAGLPKLLHLDLSRNCRLLMFENVDTFSGLNSLMSLDLSYTPLNPRTVTALTSVGKTLERLSLCYSGPYKLGPNFFANTSLRVLDVSGNHLILATDNVLGGLENKLTVLYGSEIGLSNFKIFKHFTQLEVLRLTSNEINTIDLSTAKTLKRLQFVDLRRNRFTNWSSMFARMTSLQVLDLRSNTINVINENIIQDIANVSFLAMSGNPMVCNCHAKDFIEIAARNNKYLTNFLLSPLQYDLRGFGFHRGFIDVNEFISNRTNMSLFPSDERQDTNIEGNFVLVDYERYAYTCLALPEGTTVPLEDMTGCKFRGTLDEQLQKGKTHLLALLVIPGVLLPILYIVYTYRRNLRYFCIMIRNSAMLSIVNENKIIGDDTIFNYDVFVSYCNEDRPWVLDQLLSHLENDCSVSLCLHERDFQVGLSILENIVSCMDRSKSIMLVISKQFLMSQWCQFEMHLAQHRLLETRREDLILILLEDIPRRLRPNTLHYLMLTKTYIVWPKNKSEQQVFWKRLKKSVITQRLKEDRVSLA